MPVTRLVEICGVLGVPAWEVLRRIQDRDARRRERVAVDLRAVATNAHPGLEPAAAWARKRLADGTESVWLDPTWRSAATPRP